VCLSYLEVQDRYLDSYQVMATKWVERSWLVLVHWCHTHLMDGGNKLAILSPRIDKICQATCTSRHPSPSSYVLELARPARIQGIFLLGWGYVYAETTHLLWCLPSLCLCILFVTQDINLKPASLSPRYPQYPQSYKPLPLLQIPDQNQQRLPQTLLHAICT